MIWGVVVNKPLVEVKAGGLEKLFEIAFFPA